MAGLILDPWRGRVTFVAAACCSLMAGLATAGDQAVEAASPEPAPETRRGLEVAPLADGVWLHTSFKELPGVGPYPSNGLIVKTPEGAVLIDTAWTIPQTVELLDWTASNVGAVRAIYVSHWHDDRTAGLGEATRRGIPSFGSARTRAEATAHGAPSPRRLVDDLHPLKDVGIDGELFYPGPGHTVDNIVVWLSGPRVLFGGCLVKSTSAGGLGYVADADIAQWAGTIGRVQSRYPEAKIIVPGHGAPSDDDLLAHTISLVTAAQAREDGD